MINNKFEIKFTKTEKIICSSSMFILGIMCLIGITFDVNITMKILFTICAVGCIAVGIVYIFVVNSFIVKVENDIFRVRTKKGKKYEFSVYEIQRVECLLQSTPKHGTQKTIRIQAKSENLEITDTMVGFDTVAEYLISKFDCGVLSKKVISRKCYYKLIDYKNGNC